MLRKAEDSGLFKFKKAERGEAICVAVTLLTCRHHRRAQTMKEMATIFNVPLKALNKAVKVCVLIYLLIYLFVRSFGYPEVFSPNSDEGRSNLG